MRTCVMATCWFVLAACELPPKSPEAPETSTPAARSAPSTPLIHREPALATDASTEAEAEAQVDDGIIWPSKWFAARGATLDEYDNSYGCTELVVGAAREAALLCTATEDVSAGDEENPVYRVVTRQLVRLARAGKVVTVLDLPMRIEPLDGPVAVLGEGPMPGIVDVQLAIASNGLSATVRPLDPKSDCQGRVPSAHVDKADASEADWINFDDKWRTRICNGRGKYTWKGGRFVRAR